LGFGVPDKRYKNPSYVFAEEKGSKTPVTI
jgi:hypothetical protein